MSSTPYGNDPKPSSTYEDYSQGYFAAPGNPVGSHTQGQYSQPSAASYAQPNYEQPAYAQPDPYGQPAHDQFLGYWQQNSQGIVPSVTFDSAPRPTVAMPQAVALWLKNWKNFTGRASRSEYWWVVLFQAMVGFVIMALLIILLIAIGVMTDGSNVGMGLAAVLVTSLGAIFGIATIVPTLAVTARRLHDTNQSGWMYLLSFIPYVGSFIVIYLLAQPSNPAGARFDDPNQPLRGTDS